MTHRRQASWHVLSSAMQREQLISLVHSLSASIEHRAAGSRGDRRRQREAHGEQGCTRVWRRVFEPWVSESAWAGVLARAAEYHVA